MKISKLCVLVVAMLLSIFALSSCKINPNTERQGADNVIPSESDSVSNNTTMEDPMATESDGIYTSAIENKFTAALSDNEIASALSAAESYYKNTTQQVNQLFLASEEIYTMFSIQEDSVGHIVIFEGKDSKVGANRYIILEYVSEEWKVKTEGF